jgi:hypothetical protein
MRSHPWLAEFEHELVLQYAGDHWFGDQLHVGEEDDCTSCGGKGVNHYYSWCQCWKCGETDPKSALFYKEGRSSGKRMIAKRA